MPMTVIWRVWQILGHFTALQNSLKKHKKVYGNIIYSYTSWASLVGSLVVDLDCHCNKMFGRPEKIDDQGQEMKPYFKMAINSW